MIWKSIISYEGLYEINDAGQVHSIKSNKLLKPYQGQVYLRNQNSTKTFYVFDLLSAAFGFDILSVYPIDGDRTNACLENIGKVSDFVQTPDTDIWKYIPGYEGYYQASVDGEIRSVDRLYKKEHSVAILRHGQILKQQLGDDGYLHVLLSINNKTKLMAVHRLVAMAFISNPSMYPQVNHIDGDKTNNIISNLEWCTQSQNMQHARDNNLWSPLDCGKISGNLSGIPVICVTTGKKFNSINSAAQEYDIDFESVKDSIRLKRPRKGYLFEYIE